MTALQAVRSALALLAPRDRRLLMISMGIQMATSLLDLAGILLIGLVGALSVTTIQSQPPPTQIGQLAESMGLGGLSNQALVLVLAGAASAVLLAKSIVNSYLTRRVLVFLANRQAMVSARLTRELLSRPLTFIQRRSSQETAFALVTGTGAATVHLLGQLVIVVTELALLLVLGMALLFLSPWVAIGAIVFFALIAVGLQHVLGGRAGEIGRLQARADIASLNAVQEAISGYREITVSDRRMFYVDRIQDLRWQAARVQAAGQFIGLFPKYMFEVALVIGGFLLAGALFATQDSVAAVGTLALFLAAGTRVMPSLLRLQGAALGMRGSAGVAQATFELAAELGNPLDMAEGKTDLESIKERVHAGYSDFSPSLILGHVDVTYPDSTDPALVDVTLEIAPGQSVALVGRSGAGKSTMADLILGVLEPERGTVLLGGAPPSASVRRWPGAIAYVPQHVVLANDTIRANVALGLPAAAIDDALVWEALERAHLVDDVLRGREELSTTIGEGGMRLSGGQRQRLGIARALYTRPKLIVLDEATSALDAETEQAISQTITSLGADVTTIVVAHRLATVRDVDLVVYLEKGCIRAAGTFSEVVTEVPDFRRQAQLMGLV